ncbi:hypothetical protein BSY17_4130 (plasmid) [Sphingobium sp. RAC03]|nr:hypothetical protein BSY17_4130 [Sphingobium sp. RAC03]
METLRTAIRLIEGMLPEPWNEEGQYGPLFFQSLVDRLEAIAKMTAMLADLEHQGLALFCGSTWERVVMPRWGEEGLYTRSGQPAESVRATRLLIAQIADRVTVQRAANWPVQIEDASWEVSDNTDEDIPF